MAPTLEDRGEIRMRSCMRSACTVFGLCAVSGKNRHHCQCHRNPGNPIADGWKPAAVQKKKKLIQRSFLFPQEQTLQLRASDRPIRSLHPRATTIDPRGRCRPKSARESLFPRLTQSLWGEGFRKGADILAVEP